MTGAEHYECESMGELGTQHREVLARWPHFFLSRSSPSSRPASSRPQLGPRAGRNVHNFTSFTWRRRRQTRGEGEGAACQPHLRNFARNILPSSSHSLSQPKPQHCIEHSTAINPSQSLRLGPCDSLPIGAQSALLAESRAKSSNNPSTRCRSRKMPRRLQPP